MLLRRFTVNLLLVLLVVATARAELRAAETWAQWRGPDRTGVARQANPPLQWSETKNVRWKTPLPGLGHSSPVVWEDRIYVTAAVPTGPPLETPIRDKAPGSHDNLAVTHRQQFVVLAVDRKQGDIIWRKVVHEALPHEGGHLSGSLASATPATDGKRVYAFFGSHGLYCLDRDGKLIWKHQLGRMLTKHGHGEGSSPALHGKTLVVNWDHEGQSFVAAFNTQSGKQRWRVDRNEVTSWASPIVVEHQGKPQVIVSGTERIRAYDLETGHVIWECGGLSHNVVATPVAGNGMVFAASSYETRSLLAIKLDGATGDLTDSDHVVWRRTEGTPYVPSPLLYDDSLYFLRHYQGILSRVDVRTGRNNDGPFRLGAIRNVYASPVGAAGRIYISDLSGTTMVIGHDQPRLLAINRLDEPISASAALVGNDLILRGTKHLYCLAEEKE